MGSFVTVYNYVGFRLLAPPFGLSQTVVASIFLVYLVGTVSSAAVGSLAGRIGRRRVLWAMILLMLAGLALTLADTLPLLVAGMGVFTFGFFGAHSVVSSWVGIRAMAGKAQASALYLFFYYLGSSLVGSLGGLFWTAQGWPGVGATGGRAAGGRVPDLPAPRPAAADRPDGGAPIPGNLDSGWLRHQRKAGMAHVCRRDPFPAGHLLSSAGKTVEPGGRAWRLMGARSGASPTSTSPRRGRSSSGSATAA